MQPELALIRLLLIREDYDKYRQYIEIDKTQKEILHLLKMLDSIYESHQVITFDEFYVYVLSNTQQDKFTIKTLLDRIQSIEIGKEMGETLLQQIKEKHVANKLAVKAIEVSEGRGNLFELREMVSEISSSDLAVSTDDALFVCNDLEELHKQTVQTQGLRWRLQSLNRSLGSLRKGNFGFIFARPETGKTTFLADNGSGFAEQLAEGESGFWYNNEEDGKQVQLRIIQAALGLSRYDLFLHLQENNKAYQSKIGNKLRLIDDANIHRRDVEKHCEKYNPKFIIFDQIDKIKGFEGEGREDLRLGDIYIWAREIAKCYCPVIGVTQADGTGEGVKWLTMSHVANAKTAKQAEADWILGLGYSKQDGFEYIRHCHLSKNKLPGDEDTDPKLRHGKWDIIIEPDIARYKDYE